jgi:hypothetical protein
LLGDAVNVTDVPAQIVDADALTVTVGVTFALTIIVTLLEFAVVGLAQTAVEVITQVIISEFRSAPLLYVELFAPTFTPFNFHWYDGVPPFVGAAEKVTGVPEQIVVAVALTETAGVTFAFTVIVTIFEVAVVGVAQERFDVITHETVFPFARAPFVYVGLFVPTLAPFNFHW